MPTTFFKLQNLMRRTAFITAVAAAAITLAALIAAPARADFVLPDAWARPTAASLVATFQGWETFTDPAGPNDPNAGSVIVGPGFGGTASDEWGPINAGGTANAYDISGGSFITGGGNIYSFSVATEIRSTIPNNMDGLAGDSSVGWTTLLVQIRTLGTELDPSTLSINGVSPIESVELARSSLGGFGGDLVDTWHQFQIAGNADSYSLVFDALGSSMSLDRLSVDTAWDNTATLQSQAFLNISPVPEPSTSLLAVLAVSGFGVVVRFRRRRLGHGRPLACR